MTFHPIFGLLATLAGFLFFTQVQSALKAARLSWLAPWFNPVLLTIATLAVSLSYFNIDYKTYLQGSGILTLLLYPATVSLAIPLYRNLPLLKRHFGSVSLGILVGVLVNAAIVPFLSKLLGLDSAMLLSLLPKSITTPIGMALSSQIGGIPEITVPVIVITGILGIVLGPPLFKTLHIQHPVARGIALGTASHALGTSKAIELGDVEGGMSGLAIGLTGLATAILLPFVPLLLKVLGWL